MFNGFAKYSVLSVAVVLMMACGGGGGTPKAEEGTTQGENNNSEVIATVEDSTVPVKLKKTGATKSYGQIGEVNDGSIKDDEFYQKGTTPSYTRDDVNEIVTDHITGLEWQDNVEAKTITKNWADTQIFCSNLSLDGSGWRLPSIEEFMYIVDKSKSNPAIDVAYFQNVVSSFYWSSTIAVIDENRAWVVSFESGSSSWDGKHRKNYVRCVRDGGN